MLSQIVRNVFRRTLSTKGSNVNKSRIDPQQEAFSNETCILVDENDKVTGQASKRYCHEVQADGTLPLHRAFSVFLFNKNGDFLLHRRSSKKITYPNLYTNTCCSHPLVNFPGEDEEKDALGVKRAARRRMGFELGVSPEAISLENFKYMTRLYYKDNGDGKWGEYEITTILILQDDLATNPNSDEVSELRYISRKEMDECLPTLRGQMTPWFSKILETKLMLWWDNLDNLDRFMEHEKIYRETD